MRLYGYANMSTPKAFAYVLIVYLIGIAVGAEVGKRICGRLSNSSIKQSIIWILAIASPIVIVSPWLFYHSQIAAIDNLAVPCIIVINAASLAVLFPITHHLGVAANFGGGANKGVHFSRVYLLNVLGAALGPLVTGYILFDYFSIGQIFGLLGFFYCCSCHCYFLCFFLGEGEGDHWLFCLC